MKLIIDIPEDVYEPIIKAYKKDKELQTRPNLYMAIAHGTPLDDVKAEIAKPIQEECCYIGTARIQADTIKWCLEILGNIDKAESEDKE